MYARAKLYQQPIATTQIFIRPGRVIMPPQRIPTDQLSPYEYVNMPRTIEPTPGLSKPYIFFASDSDISGFMKRLFT